MEQNKFGIGFLVTQEADDVKKRIENPRPSQASEVTPQF